MAVARARFKANPYGVVDPRAVYNSYHKGNPPDTLLTKEEVIDLSKKANIVMLTYIRDRGDPKSLDLQAPNLNLQALANRVAHDHMHLAAQRSDHSQGGAHLDSEVFSLKDSVLKRRQMEKQKAKYEEAVFLMKECDVPMKRVAKRLRLNLRKVRLLRSIPFSHVEDALMRQVRRLQF